MKKNDIDVLIEMFAGSTLDRRMAKDILASKIKNFEFNREDVAYIVTTVNQKRGLESSLYLQTIIQNYDSINNRDK